MKYLFSKARYVVFNSPHCGEGLFFYKKLSLIKYLKLKNIRFFAFEIVDNSKKRKFFELSGVDNSK